jgi:hypothetical protein
MCKRPIYLVASDSNGLDYTYPKPVCKKYFEMRHDVVFGQQMTVTSYSEKKSPVFSGGFKEPADPSTEN